MDPGQTPAAPRYTDFGLTAVSAVSGSDVWAVGNSGIEGSDVSETLTLHWDGSAWSQVASPSPGSRSNWVESVSALSATDAWAVGQYNTALDPGVTHTMTLHWDGTAWSQVASPTPNPNDYNFLQGVSARSGSDAWAVGGYWNTSGRGRSLILHWDGSAWSKIKSPNPSSDYNRLAGVSVRSGSDAWAVGDHGTAVSTSTTLIAHWNGTAWTNALAR